MSKKLTKWTKKKKERLDELERMQFNGEFTAVDPEQSELIVLDFEYIRYLKEEERKREK